MPENWYRASRICRVLGDPKTYALIQILAQEGKKTPSELAEMLQRSRSTISVHLRHLKQLDLVRFQKVGREAIYWIKEDKLVEILTDLEAYVQNIRKLK